MVVLTSVCQSASCQWNAYLLDSLLVNNQDIGSIQFTAIYVGNLDIGKTDHWTINEKKELLDIRVGI